MPRESIPCISEESSNIEPTVPGILDVKGSESAVPIADEVPEIQPRLTQFEFQPPNSQASQTIARSSSAKRRRLGRNSFSIRALTPLRHRVRRNNEMARPAQADGMDALVAVDADGPAPAQPSMEARLVLLLDHREVGAGREHAARGALLEDLANRLGPDAVEARSLPVGDVLWVWRDGCGVGGVHEFIAGWVVERKTFHDLSSSIMDGRYDEQKIRLLEAPGLEGVMYLIEGAGALFGVGDSSTDPERGAPAAQGRGFGQRLLSRQLPLSTLSTTAAHTQFISGFHAVHSTNTKHTISLLAHFHEVLRSQGPVVRSAEWVPYRSFAERTRKSCHSRVLGAFGRMLRMVPHCGPEATEALVDEFQTPHALATALRDLSDKDLLMRLKERRGGRAPVTAATLAACREMFAYG